jgi:hypothetical protein
MVREKIEIHNTEVAVEVITSLAGEGVAPRSTRSAANDGTSTVTALNSAGELADVDLPAYTDDLLARLARA